MGIPLNDPSIARAIEKGLLPSEAAKSRGKRVRKPKARPAPAASEMDFVLELVVPLRTVSALNAREHWSGRAKRVAAERFAVKAAFSVYNLTAPHCAEVTVILTRRGGRTLDSDNLASSLKGCRDEVAAWLGLDDADERLTFEYRQVPGGEWKVNIRVEGHS